MDDYGAVDRRVAALERRVAALERWRARSATAGLALGVATGLLLGVVGAGWDRPAPAIAQPQVIRARALEIVDARGRARIRLDRAVEVLDDRGRPRAGMAVGGGVATVWVGDGTGRRRISLDADADGLATVLRLLDPEGRGRLELGVRADSTPSLLLAERLGRPRILLKVLPDGLPGLWLFDQRGGILFAAR